jgi:hypothetical protein
MKIAEKQARVLSRPHFWIVTCRINYHFCDQSDVPLSTLNGKGKNCNEKHLYPRVVGVVTDLRVLLR